MIKNLKTKIASKRRYYSVTEQIEVEGTIVTKTTYPNLKF